MLQLLPGSFSDICKTIIWTVEEWNTTQVSHLPGTAASTAHPSVPPSAPAREYPQLLSVPPPAIVYERKTCRGTFVCGVTKVNSSKGKKCEVIDLTTNPSTSTITVKQPDLSTDNFVCHLSKELGHHHKNCPQYHCQVCQAHALGHFSIYCPYAPKKEHFPLVYTNEGFYDALAEWEAREDREDKKLKEEIECAHQEYMMQPKDDIMFHNTDADPIYYTNQDD